jgi:hypothetical protein
VAGLVRRPPWRNLPKPLNLRFLAGLRMFRSVRNRFYFGLLKPLSETSTAGGVR